MDEEEDNRIVHQAPPVPQNGFFPDPLAPDPIIYHIRDVTPGMSDKEKKEIYSVVAYPTRDLSDQIAGTPPDKDFSNAKPTNQVAANTFLTYVEPYVRPLTEEDMAFLRERVRPISSGIRQRLTRGRVTALHRSLLYRVENATTQRYGEKRTTLSRLIMVLTSFRQIRLVAN